VKRYENCKSGAGKRKVPLPVVSSMQLLQPLERTIVYHEGIVCGERKKTDVVVDKQRRDCLSRTRVFGGRVLWWWCGVVVGGGG